MPLPAIERRVSGRKNMIDKRLSPEAITKNQKIDRNPRYWERIPPNTGPIPWPNMRTGYG